MNNFEKYSMTDVFFAALSMYLGAESEIQLTVGNCRSIIYDLQYALMYYFIVTYSDELIKFAGKSYIKNKIEVIKKKDFASMFKNDITYVLCDQVIAFISYKDPDITYLVDDTTSKLDLHDLLKVIYGFYKIRAPYKGALFDLLLSCYNEKPMFGNIK